MRQRTSFGRTLGVAMVVALAASARLQAADIVCTPGDMTPTIQNALDGFQGSSGTVTVHGNCTLASALFMRTSTALTGPATLTYQGTGAAIYFRGVTRAALRDLVVTSPSGSGLQFDNGGGNHRVRDVQVNAYGGHGFILASGAGLWVDNVHINGTAGRGTSGFLVNGTWDSLWVTNTLTEEQDTGFRIGGFSGTIGNVWLTNVVMDRLRGVGLHVEPWATGTVVNIQAVGMWSSGSHAMLLNASETSGTVASIILTNWRATESPNGIWVAGNVQHLSTSQIISF